MKTRDRRLIIRAILPFAAAVMTGVLTTTVAAQFGGPRTTAISPIAYEFMGNWGWATPRFDCGNVRDSFGRKTIVGDGKLETHPTGNLNLCQWPIVELEKAMNGRGRLWVQTFSSDDAISAKWTCAISWGEAITAGGRTFSQRADSIVMWFQAPQAARIVWTDGRKHPPATDMYYWGHSIGWMEGKTFVVETTNFTWDTDGYDDQSHIARSHVAKWIERYTLTDNDNMEVQFIVEDPVFLKDTFTWTAKMKRATAPYENSYECDPATEAQAIYSTFKNPYPDDNTLQRFFGEKVEQK
jgi:hypothetical protein